MVKPIITNRTYPEPFHSESANESKKSNQIKGLRGFLPNLPRTSMTKVPPGGGAASRATQNLSSGTPREADGALDKPLYRLCKHLKIL